MKRKQLESALSCMTYEFPQPNITLEQYPTDPELASYVVWYAYDVRQDIGPGRSSLDLGCGTGILLCGMALLQTDLVLGIDCDTMALQIAQQNVQTMKWNDDDNSSQIDFICASVSDFSNDDSNDNSTNDTTVQQQEQQDDKPFDDNNDGLNDCNGDNDSNNTGHNNHNNDSGNDDDENNDRDDDDCVAIRSKQSDNRRRPKQGQPPPSKQGGFGRFDGGKSRKKGGRHRKNNFPNNTNNTNSICSTNRIRSIIMLDNDGIPLRSNCVDTVMMNPPFGTKNNAGMDLRFLRTGCRLARRAVYSFHKSSTTQSFLVPYIQTQWHYAKVEIIAQMKFAIPKMYHFHKEPILYVDVDLIRIDITSYQPPLTK